jgi:hypothetical protein
MMMPVSGSVLFSDNYSCSISIMITFNTIRLAIYISREEISVMRLVGASSKFVRGPFVIVGIMYGIVAALITICAFLSRNILSRPSNSKLLHRHQYFQLLYCKFRSDFRILLGAGVLDRRSVELFGNRRYLSLIRNGMKKKHKYIFVIGGVMSGVGKGIATSSIGKILKPKVTGSIQ